LEQSAIRHSTDPIIRPHQIALPGTGAALAFSAVNSTSKVKVYHAGNDGSVNIFYVDNVLFIKQKKSIADIKSYNNFIPLTVCL